MITLTIEKSNNHFNHLMIRGYNDRLQLDYPLTYYNALTVDEVIKDYKKHNDINDDNIKIINYYTAQTGLL